MTERTKPADTTEENDESGKDGAQQIVDFGSALTKTPHGSVYCMTIIGQRPPNMSMCCPCWPSWRRATR